MVSLLVGLATERWCGKLFGATAIELVRVTFAHMGRRTVLLHHGYGLETKLVMLLLNATVGFVVAHLGFNHLIFHTFNLAKLSKCCLLLVHNFNLS